MRRPIGTPLSTNMRKFRKRKGLTQQELANLAGYTRGYLGSLESGVSAASMAVLEKLSKALEVSVADLLAAPESSPGLPSDSAKTAILNDPSSDSLISPIKRKAAQDGFLMPSVRAGDSFALYLPDDSMAPEFGKGDLVVFSRSRKPAEGQACLVDRGKGQVFFRTVWALPGGGWGLKASNPKYKPVVIKSSKALRMWPAIGYWRMLSQRRGG